MTLKCKRCENEAVKESRGEPFCKACFIKFIQFRQRKQMEKFKVDYSEPRPPDQHILLPISLGASSIALLDMCVELIRAQKTVHRGRQGFYLHALHILEEENSDNVKCILEKLRERYPECEEITTVSLLSQIKDGEIESIKISNHDSTTTDDLITIMNQHMNKTSREDTISILRKQLIDRYAEQAGCQTIIYGHCQTRISELVIAMTSKGRGSAMPHTINEAGYYPLREVLSSEVQIYNELQQITDSVIPKQSPPANVKLQTIDDLVYQYFISVEKDFPSVVSTVAKTANKLASTSTTASTTKYCSVCGDISGDDTLEWVKKITVNAPTEDAGETLCYGCMVMLRNTTNQLNWPRYNKDDVINAYEL